MKSANDINPYVKPSEYIRLPFQMSESSTDGPDLHPRGTPPSHNTRPLPQPPGSSYLIVTDNSGVYETLSKAKARKQFPQAHNRVPAHQAFRQPRDAQQTAAGHHKTLPTRLLWLQWCLLLCHLILYINLIGHLVDTLVLLLQFPLAGSSGVWNLCPQILVC